MVDTEIRKLRDSYIVEWYSWADFKRGIKAFKTLREAEEFAHGKNPFHETPVHLLNLEHDD